MKVRILWKLIFPKFSFGILYIALSSFFEFNRRKSLYDFISTHTPLCEKYIRQFLKATEAKKNLINKFKSEYKIKNSSSKRYPSVTFDFDKLWSCVLFLCWATYEKQEVGFVFSGMVNLFEYTAYYSVPLNINFITDVQEKQDFWYFNNCWFAWKYVVVLECM